MPLTLDIGALSGLGNGPGIRFPGLIEACIGSRSQIDESRMSTRRLAWSRRTQGESEGPKRRLSGHLTSGRGDLNLGGGALRRSDPMGPRGTPMNLCPWHEGFDIRMEVGWDQLQAMFVLDESTDSAGGGRAGW